MADDVNVSAPQADATPSAPVSTPAQATSSATAQPVATPQATPQAQATEPNPAMVPSYRLREAREAATRQAQQQLAQREAYWQNELQRVQSQVRALTGVQAPVDPQVDAVRQQFGQLYPGLSQLEQQAQQLQELLGQADDYRAMVEHHWQSYGRSSMDSLFRLAEQSIGAPLTDEGKRGLHSAFTGWVSQSPEMTERYASDPSVVNEFWQQFTSSFIDPVRRTASATVANRAQGVPIPQDTPSGALPTSKPAQFKDLDERTAGAWALYNAKVRK